MEVGGGIGCSCEEAGDGARQVPCRVVRPSSRWLLLLSLFEGVSLFFSFKKNGFSRLHTSKNKQWPSERSLSPTASQHWHGPPLSVSPQCTHPIQLAGVIGLAGRVSICNLNTVTRPHIFLLSSYFLPHCIFSPALAAFPGNTVLLLTSLQHSSGFSLFWWWWWWGVSGGWWDVRKISSAQSVVSSGEVKAAGALQWCRGARGEWKTEGSGRHSAAVGKLRDQVTLAGGKFTSLAISVKGCEDGRRAAGDWLSFVPGGVG